jgi:Domain of unknown function (DUF4388)
VNDHSSSFRGRLKALSIADLLEFLRVLNRRGLLTVSGEAVTVGLYLQEGRLVHATSSRDADRLSELLLRWGLVSRAQYDDAMRRAAAGERIGKALVAAGGLTPRGLLEARARQVRQIALSLFDWSAGEFAFLEGEAPDDEGILVAIDLLELVAEGIRTLRTPGLFRERMPSPEWVFEPIPAAERKASVALEAQEDYVLRLVDGSRTVGALVEASEFPEAETLRILFLMVCVGILKMKSFPTAEDEGTVETTGDIVRRYNGMYGRVFQHLMREVGPISEPLLGKALRELQGSVPVLFSRASFGGDGTLDAAVLDENLRGLSGARRRETLVQGLNELLYAELLLVRRTLGPEHEGRVLRALRTDDLPAQVHAGGRV